MHALDASLFLVVTAIVVLVGSTVSRILREDRRLHETFLSGTRMRCSCGYQVDVHSTAESRAAANLHRMVVTRRG